jgi:hypothetical protein
VNWQIVEASAREVFEAYWEALDRRDAGRIFFWRSVLLERLAVLNGATHNSVEPPGAYGAGPEG